MWQRARKAFGLHAKPLVSTQSLWLAHRAFLVHTQKYLVCTKGIWFTLGSLPEPAATPHTDFLQPSSHQLLHICTHTHAPAAALPAAMGCHHRRLLSPAPPRTAQCPDAGAGSGAEGQPLPPAEHLGKNTQVRVTVCALQKPMCCVGLYQCTGIHTFTFTHTLTLTPSLPLPTVLTVF